MEFRLEDPLILQGDAFTKTVTDTEAQESYLVHFKFFTL
jgi:hypothetical protein